jgi:SAM-dependent methyltransferase
MSSTSYYDADFPLEELEQSGVQFEGATSELAQPQRARFLAAVADSSWSGFYERHENKFFKPRMFTVAEFPLLRFAARILEVGAGNGSNIAVLLNETPAKLWISDFQAGIVRVAIQAVPFASIHRVVPCLFDVASGVAQAVGPVLDVEGDPAPRPFEEPTDLDAVVMTFVLSALHPEQHVVALRHARDRLCVGGRLCFRDYGVWDHAMLRVKPDNVLGRRLHARGDGTLVTYFE